MAARIGELLGRLVELSAHDVEEILEEQRYTGHRFGEIALAWGLCAPADIWHAWSNQLDHKIQHVTLAAVGIDTQAISLLSAELANQYQVIPLRAVEDLLVLATSEESFERAQAELPGQLQQKLRFVIADTAQLHRAIVKHYGAAQAAKIEALAGAA